MGLCALVVFFLVCSAARAQEQFYEWHDQDGTLHVTNQVSTRRGAAPIADAPPSAAADTRPAEESARVDPASAPPASDPSLEALARREARLAARQAHLDLLRASRDPNDAARLQLENVLQDEVHEETAAIAELRRAAKDRAP